MDLQGTVARETGAREKQSKTVRGSCSAQEQQKSANAQLLPPGRVAGCELHAAPHPQLAGSLAAELQLEGPGAAWPQAGSGLAAGAAQSSASS